MPSLVFIRFHQAVSIYSSFRLKRKRGCPDTATSPVVRIGRLAVDQACNGRGLGSALIYDAINRVIQSGIGVYAVVVDAKDETAVAFYQHMGFDTLADKEDVLYLPIASTNVQESSRRSP